MAIHGTATIPIVIDNCLYQVSDIYLVDMSPKIQGVFSDKFLADYELQLSFTFDGMQRLIAPPQ